MQQAIKDFYINALPQHEIDGATSTLSAQCPWCDEGRILIELDPKAPFFGHFHCQNHCSHGGHALDFARRMSIDPVKVPGYDQDREPTYRPPAFPFSHKNGEMHRLARMCTAPIQAPFRQAGIDGRVIELMHVGYNGRLYVYPYLQEDGNCYSLRAVPFTGKFDQPLWQGEETFTAPPHNLFNTPDIARADGGTLIVTMSERNALAAKQAGFNVVAIPTYQDETCIDDQRLEFVRQVVLIMNNDQEGRDVAHQIALRLGFKARIVRWDSHLKKGFGLFDLLNETCGSQLDHNGHCTFRSVLTAMVAESEPLSPLPSAKKEFAFFNEQIESHRGREFLGLKTCFGRLNHALDGLRGLNVLGAQPKAGKSTFFMQVASSLAEEQVPVIYYDFENGRQKVYSRILSRMSRMSEREILSENLSPDDGTRIEETMRQFRSMLMQFKVVSDRKISPDLMRKQIEFLRSQTNSADMLLVIDSLHKLPFARLTERRSGIDAWLRQMESIRDEEAVTFLVISELSRSVEGGYDREPDLASFKETGDIEYTADNALVMTTRGSAYRNTETTTTDRVVDLWLVATREMSPGKIASYRVDYPYWSFQEEDPGYVP